jgi:putative ABC transport system permease protein
MLVVALAAAVACALACGVFPAMAAMRRTSTKGLVTVGSASSTTPTSSRARQALVSLQFAMALMLLVGAGLLVHSLVRAADVNVGFEPRGLYTMRITPPDRPAAPQRAALYGRLMEQMRATPGVRDAAFINHAPFNPASITTTMLVEGRSTVDSSSQLFYRTASSNYPRVMQMTMREGRWFDGAEERSGAAAFVVNETAAKQYWPGASPIGARVRVAKSNQSVRDFGTFVPGTIVGVVRDVHQVSQDVSPVAEVYVPYTMEPWGWGMLMVRAEAAALPAVREAVRSVDTRLVAESNTAPFTHLEVAVRRRLESRHFAIRLIGAFALTGTLLACLGLYGVMAYNVTQRTRELALRKAMGATDARVIGLVLGSSGRIIAAGSVVGGFGAWIGARWLSGLLFQTSAIDPLVYVSAIAGLALIAMAATLVPALRASRLDPAIAIRQE